MQPQDAGCGGRPNRTNCHHYISTATSLNSILTSPWFPQLSLSLSKTNISYLLRALKSHGLMPSPQLTLSRKPSFICLRKIETNGQKVSQPPPTMTANLPVSQWPALLEDAPPSTSLIYHLCWELHLFPGISLYWPFPLSCIYFKLSFFTGSFLSAAKPALLQIVLWPLNLKSNKIFLKVEEEVTSIGYQQLIVRVQTIK